MRYPEITSYPASLNIWDFGCLYIWSDSPRSPFGENCELEARYPPCKKRYLNDTCARPWEKQGRWMQSSLRCYLRKVLHDISIWAATLAQYPCSINFVQISFFHFFFSLCFVSGGHKTWGSWEAILAWMQAGRCAKLVHSKYSQRCPPTFTIRHNSLPTPEEKSGTGLLSSTDAQCAPFRTDFGIITQLLVHSLYKLRGHYPLGSLSLSNVYSIAVAI